jgi:hypothetical protein
VIGDVELTAEARPDATWASIDLRLQYLATAS